MSIKQHTLFLALMLCLLSIPAVIKAQTTEGNDFWLTFLQADQNDVSDSDESKMITLQLSISAKQACDVTIKNEITGQTKTLSIAANELKDVELYKGSSVRNVARQHQLEANGIVCYSMSPEKIDSSAIHVTSTAPISLFAANYRSKSFDATNVLPTSALLDEYIIQAIAPSDHENKPQGTHFAIVATEDNTVVEYTPTVLTQAAREFQTQYNTWGDNLFNQYPEYRRYENYTLGQTLVTDTLMKGQVYYVWSGKYAGADADLSGTTIKARDGKKIAVFQGAPHTNIPDGIRDRDHLFSQAVPTPYWGNTFAITASMTRQRDIVTVQAKEDGTTVKVNGQIVHTFDFSNNPSRTYQFEIGAAGNTFTSKDKNKKDCTLPDPLVIGNSCFIETSCAAATHIFMVSNQYDANAKGDPAMVWVNPIEQRISDITFATYRSSNTHYVNIVTDAAGVESMTLDGDSIASDFEPVAGSNNRYYFARKNISYNTHRLHNTTGFIAHVYGYGEKESYGYSAGGSAVVLEQFVMINGEVFTPETANSLCGTDTVHFSCDLSYAVNSITWNFGDGSPEVSADSTAHYYEHTGVYNASVTITRESSNLCQGQLAVTVIPFTVTIGKLEFTVDSTINHICENRQMELYYSNTGTPLNSNNCTIEFNDKANSFPPVVLENGYFLLTVPTDAAEGDGYAFKITTHIGCNDTTVTVPFAVPFDASKLVRQRYTNVFVVDTTILNATQVVGYQWYENGVAMENETASVLNLHEGTSGNEYKVRITYMKDGVRQEQETCGVHFDGTRNDGNLAFGDPQGVSAVSGQAGEQLYFCTTATGEAALYNIKGQLIDTYQLDATGGLITLPNDKGIFVVKIKTANEQAALKLYVY